MADISIDDATKPTGNSRRRTPRKYEVPDGELTFSETVKQGFGFAKDNPELTTNLTAPKIDTEFYRDVLDERGFRDVRGETDEELEAAFREKNAALDFRYIRGEATRRFFEARGISEKEIASSGGARFLGEFGAYIAGGPGEIAITGATIAGSFLLSPLTGGASIAAGLGSIAARTAARHAAVQAVFRASGVGAYQRLAAKAVFTNSIRSSIGRGAIRTAAVNAPLEVGLQTAIAAGRIDRKEADLGEAVIDAAINVAAVAGGSAVLGGIASGLGKAYKVGRADTDQVRRRINKNLLSVAEHQGRGEVLQAERAAGKVLKDLLDPLQNQYLISTNAEEREGIVQVIKLLEDSLPGKNHPKVEQIIYALNQGREILEVAEILEREGSIFAQAADLAKELDASIDKAYAQLGFEKRSAADIGKLELTESVGATSASGAVSKTPRLIIRSTDEDGNITEKLLASPGENPADIKGDIWVHILDEEDSILVFSKGREDMFRVPAIKRGLYIINNKLINAETTDEIAEAVAEATGIFGKTNANQLFHTFRTSDDNILEIEKKVAEILKKNKAKDPIEGEANFAYHAVSKIYGEINQGWNTARAADVKARETGGVSGKAKKSKRELVYSPEARAVLENMPDFSEFALGVERQLAVADFLKRRGEALLAILTKDVDGKALIREGAKDGSIIDVGTILTAGLGGGEGAVGKIARLLITRGEVLSLLDDKTIKNLAKQIDGLPDGARSDLKLLVAEVERALVEGLATKTRTIAEARGLVSRDANTLKLETPEERTLAEQAKLNKQITDFVRSENVAGIISEITKNTGLNVGEATILALGEVIEKGMTDSLLYANATARTAEIITQFFARHQLGDIDDVSLQFSRLFIPSNGDRTFQTLQDQIDITTAEIFRSLEIGTQNPKTGLGLLSTLGPRAFSRRAKLRTKDFTLDEYERALFSGDTENPELKGLIERIRKWEEETFIPRLQRSGIPARFRQNYAPNPGINKGKLEAGVRRRAAEMRAEGNDFLTRSADDGPNPHLEVIRKLDDAELEAKAYKEIQERFYEFRSVDESKSAPGFSSELEIGYWKSLYSKDIAREFPGYTTEETFIKALNKTTDTARTAERAVFGQSEHLTETPPLEKTGASQATRMPLEALTGERVWHMKSYDDWLEFDSLYGTQQKISELYHIHWQNAGHGLAQIDMLGLAPRLSVSMIADTIIRAGKNLTSTEQTTLKANVIRGLDSFNAKDGLFYQPLSHNAERLANATTSFRNGAIYTKLGSALLSSIPDVVGSAQTLNIITGKILDPITRKTLTRQGGTGLFIEGLMRRSVPKWNQAQGIRMHHAASKPGGVIDTINSLAKDMKEEFEQNIKLHGKPFAVQVLVNRGIYIESLLNIGTSSQNHHRFSLDTDRDAPDKFSRGLRTAANLTLRMTGLSQWTEQGIIINKELFLNDLGSKVKARISWDQLEKAQAWMKHFGIDRAEWEDLIRFGEKYVIEENHGIAGKRQYFDFFQLILDAESGTVRGTEGLKEAGLNKRLLKIARGVGRGVRDASDRSIPQAGEKELLSTGIIGDGKHVGGKTKEAISSTGVFHGYAASIARHQIWHTLLGYLGRGTTDLSGRNPLLVSRGTSSPFANSLPKKKERIAEASARAARGAPAREEEEIAQHLNPYLHGVAGKARLMIAGFAVLEIYALVRNEDRPDYSDPKEYGKAAVRSGYLVSDNVNTLTGGQGFGGGLGGAPLDVATDAVALGIKAPAKAVETLPFTPDKVEPFGVISDRKAKNRARSLLAPQLRWWWVDAALQRMSFDALEKWIEEFPSREAPQIPGSDAPPLTYEGDSASPNGDGEAGG